MTTTETDESATTEAKTIVEAPVTKSVETKAGAKLSYDELDEYHERAIKDNVSLRTKNSEYKARMKELEEQAGKATALEEQVTKIEAKAREKVTNAEFWALLKADGVTDRDALKLLDTSTVKYDEDGDPINVAEIYEGFKESKSYLFGGNTKAETKSTSVLKAPEAKATTGIDWNTATAEEMARARKPSRLQQ
jgi:cell division septum initiation protein DivIVA